LSFFLILFYSGYRLGVKKIKAIPIDFTKDKEIRILNFVQFCIIIIIGVQLIALLSSIMREGFVLKSPAEMYVEAYVDYQRNIGREYNLWEIMNILAGTFKQVGTILGFYYFMEMKTKWKVLFILLVLIIALNTFILMGKQKQIGDLVILMLGVFLIKFSTLSIKIPRKYKFLVVALFIVVFLAFANSQKSRLAFSNVDLSNYNLKALSSVYIKENHPVFWIFGEDLGFGVSLISSYVTQGYYGLSQTLDLPFEWTYGLGNSYAIAVAANRFFGLPFYYDTKTYPFRAEKETGWPAYKKWHTIFPWLASDFTFLGAIIILTIVAFIYAICWIESYRYGNPFSIVMFCTISIMLIYVPANNQLMGSPESVIMVFSLFIAWVLKHKSYNFNVHGYS